MKLSVIVATRNRAHAVARCLDSIAASLAHAGAPDAEIVVVDNGSTDGTAAIVGAWAAAAGVGVQVLCEPAPGLARARNLGLAHARGDLLAFTDDDCRLDRDHVRQLLAYDAGDAGLVLRGGHVRLGDPVDLPLTVTAPTRRRWHRDTDPVRHDNIGAFILGCNMTMRRRLAERIGPFDVTFGAGTVLNAGEDHEYALRAYCAGATIDIVPDMAVAHFHGRKTAAEGHDLMRAYMRGSGAVYAKYACVAPGLCRQAYWDCKSAARELMTGANLFLPEIGFSARDKLSCYVRGAARYALRPRHP
jgi:glycosyltransferase involved in cell wall biosynthesis